MAKPKRAIFDTNVWISALLWTGVPHKLLEHADRGKVKCYATIDMLHELEEVLDRPKFADRIAELETSVEEIMLSVLNTVTIIKKTRLPSLLPSELPRDADDAMFIECALLAKAKYLVSGDPDLLVLKRVRAVEILSPAEFLRRLEAA